MQVLGILSANGKAIEKCTVTMYSSVEERAEIDTAHARMEKLSGKTIPYMRYRFMREFAQHKDRLERGGADETRFFPLETPEAQRYHPVVRMAVHGIAA